MAKVSDLAGQVAADEFLVWMQEQAISTGKALLPEEATDKIIEATFSKLTESKKGLLPQSGTQALQPVRVGSCALDADVVCVPGVSLSAVPVL